MIIEWPLNGLFNAAVNDVLMSQTDVREMDDDDDVQTLLVVFNRY